jgi:hypothetical protein
VSTHPVRITEELLELKSSGVGEVVYFWNFNEFHTVARKNTRYKSIDSTPNELNLVRSSHNSSVHPF